MSNYKRKNPLNKNFKIYVYLDSRKKGKYQYGKYSFDYEPFYIGKGYDEEKNYKSRDRQFYHIKEAKRKKKQIKNKNLLKINKIKKIIKTTGNDPIIIIYKNNLTEQKSLSLEKHMIKTIGRYDFKKGPLTNLTNGGEGSSGRPMNENTKYGLLKANKGRICSKKQKEKTSKALKGKTFSKERNEKISKALKGHEFSEETLEKMRGKRESITGEKNGMYDKKHTSKSRRLMGLNRTTNVKILIDNVFYRSISEACRILNYTRTYIRYRLNLKKYPNFQYV